MHPRRLIRDLRRGRLRRGQRAAASGFGLVLAAVLSASAATWRLRTAPASTGFLLPDPARPPLSFAAVLDPAPQSPGRSSSGAPEEVLARLRVRARQGDVRMPAVEVDRWIVRFATDPRRRRSMEEGLGRMTRFEPLVRETLRRHGQPEELIALVMIESEFRETAVSRAGATGLWQFMSSTGRLYDLEISEYVDERRDPVRSSDAAVRHLADLHRRMGSWHLALAAYNAGAGRVERTLRRHGLAPIPGDESLYWRIRRDLPAETQRYVPMILAAAEIARDPGAFGFRVRTEPPLTYTHLWVPGGVTMDAVARAQGVAPLAVRGLNPHLVRGITPPGRAWPVRVPVATRHGIPVLHPTDAR